MVSSLQATPPSPLASDMEVDSDADSSVSDLFAAVGNAQEVSLPSMPIRRLSLSGMVKHVNAHQKEGEAEVSKGTPLDELIRRVVRVFERTKEGKENPKKFETLTPTEQEINWQPIVPDGNPFKFQGFYRMTTARSLAVHRFLQKFDSSIEFSSTQPELLFFLYRNAEEIFALTHRNAFFAILHCIDHNFTAPLVKRLVDPDEITLIKVRYLVGNILKDEEALKITRGGNDLGRLDRVYNSISSTFKLDASIYSLFPFHKTELPRTDKDRVCVEFSRQLIQIRSKLSLKEICFILDHFAKMAAGQTTLTVPTKLGESPQEEVDDHGFDFFDFVRPVEWRHVDRLNAELLRDLERVIRNPGVSHSFYLSHRYVDDFQRSNHFVIKRNEYELFTWTTRFTLDNLLNLLRERKLDSAKIAKEIQITFYRRGKPITEELIHFIEGQMQDGNGVQYFRLGSVWYEVSSQYLLHITRDFRTVLKHHLMAPEEAKRLLPLPWEHKQKENDYSKRYLSEKAGESPQGYLMGDRNCAIRGDIELFDLLYFDEYFLYFIHVKPGFGQHTRDACSQLMNAATVFDKARKDGNDLAMLLNDIWDRLTSDPQSSFCKQLLSFSPKRDYREAKENFFALFQSKRKPVFVYAFRGSSIDTNTGVRWLHRDNRSVQFTEKDLEGIVFSKQVAERVIRRLKELKYLDANGWPTQYLYFNIPHAHNTRIPLDLPGWVSENTEKLIREKLFHVCVSQYNTLIAELDLIRTRHVMREKDLDFKICQIDEVGETPPLAHTVSAAGSQTAIPPLEFTHQGQQMKRQATRGCGSCALHALLGKPNGTQIAYQPMGTDDPDTAVKQFYLDELEKHLSHPAIQKTYHDLVDWLFSPLESFKNAFYALKAELLKKFRCSLPNHPNFPKFVQEMDGDLDQLNSSPDALTAFYNDHSLSLMKEFQDDLLIQPLIEEERQFQAKCQQTLSAPEIFERYKQLVLPKEYSLHTDELHLAGLLFNRTVALYRLKDGQIIFEGYLGKEEATTVHIYFNGTDHFEQCTPLTTPSTPPAPPTPAGSQPPPLPLRRQSTLADYFPGTPSPAKRPSSSKQPKSKK